MVELWMLYSFVSDFQYKIKINFCDESESLIVRKCKKIWFMEEVGAYEALKCEKQEEFFKYFDSLQSMNNETIIYIPAKK